MSASALLEVVGLEVRFGGTVALDSVSFAVGPGAAVGLIGPNGAGKTTLIDAVTGFTTATGRIVLDGRAIDRLPPHQRARRGLARTFQSLELFEDLTVEENVLVAAHQQSSARRALERVCLAWAVDVSPTPLSHADRTLVAVARALAADPSLLLLDEPAAGLDRHATAALGAELGRIRASGTALLLVDHDVDLVFAVCDHVLVLDLGRIIASGTPMEIRSDSAVARAYLGPGGSS